MASGRLWAALGRLLGSWALGVSWAALRWLLAALGRSWAALVGSWATFGGYEALEPFFGRQLNVFKGFWGADLGHQELAQQGNLVPRGR